MHESWRRRPSWEEPPARKVPHGTFIGRLPKGAIPCSEPMGYSMWHLLAAKCLDPDQQELFLMNACDVGTNELIDDLRESMTVFNDTWRKSWYENSEMRSSRFGWNRLRRETAWCTPLQICARLQVPLIFFNEDWVLPSLHPVIEAAQAQSLRNLGI